MNNISSDAIRVEGGEGLWGDRLIWRMRALGRLLRMAHRRRRLRQRILAETRDPRCLADFGIDEGGEVFNKTAAAMARALGGR